MLDAQQPLCKLHNPWNCGSLKYFAAALFCSEFIFCRGHLAMQHLILHLLSFFLEGFIERCSLLMGCTGTRTTRRSCCCTRGTTERQWRTWSASWRTLWLTGGKSAPAWRPRQNRRATSRTCWRSSTALPRRALDRSPTATCSCSRCVALFPAEGFNPCEAFSR